MAAAYDQISPTAKLVAELRRYAALPRADEIANAIGATEAVRTAIGGELSPGVLTWMAPLTEARYLSLRVAIERSGARQVIELAAGFAFRAAAMPGLRYLETDLPDVHAERTRVAAELGLDATHFAAADATSAADLERLASRLAPDRPVAIVCEGLCQYLTRDEKRAVALGIAALLERFGGVWCTPDFETTDDPLFRGWTDPQFAAIGTFLASATQRDLRGAAFTSRDDVRAFFTDLGFTVEHAPQLDGSFELASAARVGTSPAQLAALRDSRQLWTLTRRPSRG
jgi:O-methyltransferase involved in polyketide biosynthesis